LAGTAIGLLVLAFFWLPGLMVHGKLTEVQRLNARNDVRGAAIQAIGAMAVAVGFFLTARTYLLTRHGQITDRFTKAVEQLNDEKGRLTLRLAAVVALDRIAREADPSFHWQVMDVLTGYLREHAKWRPATPAPERARADVQAIVNVLGRRAREKEKADQRLNLRGADLRQVHFAAESHLERADLTRAHLEGAVATGSVHFEDCVFVEAVLDRVIFNDVHLERADLRNAKVRDRAQMRRAYFKDAVLIETEFDGADLQGARDADLTSAVIRNTTLP
jgi:Pentapeptide repeats (8 copies)